jgi:hypothetical protein
LLLGSETEEDRMKDEDSMTEKKNEMWGDSRCVGLGLRWWRRILRICRTYGTGEFIDEEPSAHALG